MNAADVVALPFFDVLSSGSAILPMSFGNPVVSPDIGCVSTLLAIQSKLVYDPDHEGALAQTLQTATTLDTDAIGERNRQWMLDAHDWDGVAAQKCQV